METHLIFWMPILSVSLKCLFCANHMRTLRTLVGEGVWEMLGLDVCLEVVFVIHGLIADSTIE